MTARCDHYKYQDVGYTGYYASPQTPWTNLSNGEIPDGANDWTSTYGPITAGGLPVTLAPGGQADITFAVPALPNSVLAQMNLLVVASPSAKYVRMVPYQEVPNDWTISSLDYKVVGSLFAAGVPTTITFTRLRVGAAADVTIASTAGYTFSTATVALPAYGSGSVSITATKAAAPFGTTFSFTNTGGLANPSDIALPNVLVPDPGVTIGDTGGLLSTDYSFQHLFTGQGGSSELPLVNNAGGTATYTLRNLYETVSVTVTSIDLYIRTRNCDTPTWACSSHNGVVTLAWRCSTDDKLYTAQHRSMNANEGNPSVGWEASSEVDRYAVGNTDPQAVNYSGLTGNNRALGLCHTAIGTALLSYQKNGIPFTQINKSSGAAGYWSGKLPSLNRYNSYFETTLNYQTPYQGGGPGYGEIHSGGFNDSMAYLFGSSLVLMTTLDGERSR